LPFCRPLINVALAFVVKDVAVVDGFVADAVGGRIVLLCSFGSRVLKYN